MLMKDMPKNSPQIPPMETIKLNLINTCHIISLNLLYLWNPNMILPQFVYVIILANQSLIWSQHFQTHHGIFCVIKLYLDFTGLLTVHNKLTRPTRKYYCILVPHMTADTRIVFFRPLIYLTQMYNYIKKKKYINFLNAY